MNNNNEINLDDLFDEIDKEVSQKKTNEGKKKNNWKKKKNKKRREEQSVKKEKKMMENNQELLPELHIEKMQQIPEPEMVEVEESIDHNKQSMHPSKLKNSKKVNEPKLEESLVNPNPDKEKLELELNSLKAEIPTVIPEPVVDDKILTSETTLEEPKKTIQKEEKIDFDNRLRIGQNDRRTNLFISETNRYLNTAIIGSKGTGKTTSILPFFAEQDIEKKKAGITFIVSDREMAYALYSMCKEHKRRVHMLKPSTDNEINNKFLWMEEYNYDYINEQIINYKEAIKRKDVVIIDMEPFKYKSDAIKAVSMLLLQLRLDLQDTDITQRHPHFLYVDDASTYLRFLDDILKYGENYNLGTILFLESRSQLEPEYRNMIDNHVRNILLLNKVPIEDYEYYKVFFSEKNYENFYGREKTSILYQSVDNKGMNRTGLTKIKQVLIDMEELTKKSKKIRAALLKEKRKKREKALFDKSDNSNYTNEPKPIDDTTLQTIIDDAQLPEKSYMEDMGDKIKEKIESEEKETKRKVAENMFNHYKKKIVFCDDLFDME